MPSALVECLFMTNAREEQMLLSDAFLDKIAEAIARGIEQFEGVRGTLIWRIGAIFAPNNKQGAERKSEKHV